MRLALVLALAIPLSGCDGEAVSASKPQCDPINHVGTLGPKPTPIDIWTHQGAIVEDCIIMRAYQFAGLDLPLPDVAKAVVGACREAISREATAYASAMVAEGQTRTIRGTNKGEEIQPEEDFRDAAYDLALAHLAIGRLSKCKVE